MKTKFVFIVFFFFFFFTFQVVLADLKIGFYRTTCPRAESIIFGVVRRRFTSDTSITAALLRMHFHDCFVRGCDASILIDSKDEKQSEKDAGANLTVRGFELIDEAKQALEEECPLTVSCADIITLATRDAVALAGGLHYTVPTGRLDGLQSNVGDVNLPGPSVSVSDVLQIFTSKGMNLNDMVTLLGAHTVGFAHCNFFQNRLSSPDDGSMDPALLNQLKRNCTSSNDNPTAFLDQMTAFVFDNQFYKQIKLRRGILKIDQNLADDESTAAIVSRFASNPVTFQRSFANSMIKMGNLVANDGNVRQNCRVFN